MLCVPAEFGVIVTVHVDLSVLDAASAQEPLTVPPTTLEPTVTIVPTPVLDFVPFASSSVTVTVAVVVGPMTSGLLLKLTVVVVWRVLTFRLALPVLRE